MHLIDQLGNPDDAHDSQELLGALSSKLSDNPKRETRPQKQLPLTTEKVSNNVFQPTAPKKPSYVLSAQQQTKNINNVIEGVKKDKSDPSKNINNNIPVDQKNVIKEKDVN